MYVVHEIFDHNPFTVAAYGPFTTMAQAQSAADVLAKRTVAEDAEFHSDYPFKWLDSRFLSYDGDYGYLVVKVGEI